MAARRSRPWGPGFDTWQSLFGFVYRGLALGLCVAVFALPLAAVLIGLPRPWETVPLLMLCALPLGPALSAALFAFEAEREQGSSTPFAHFIAGLRHTGWRGLGVWAIGLALLLFLYVDAVAVSGTPFALLLGPLFGVLALIVIATLPVALSALGLPQRPGVLSAAKAGLYATVRRPLPSVVTLVVVAAWVVITLAQPVIGVLALGGFTLMLTGMNATAQLTAVGAC